MAGATTESQPGQEKDVDNIRKPKVASKKAKRNIGEMGNLIERRTIFQ